MPAPGYRIVRPLSKVSSPHVICEVTSVLFNYFDFLVLNSLMLLTRHFIWKRDNDLTDVKNIHECIRLETELIEPLMSDETCDSTYFWLEHCKLLQSHLTFSTNDNRTQKCAYTLFWLKWDMVSIILALSCHET